MSFAFLAYRVIIIIISVYEDPLGSSTIHPLNSLSVALLGDPTSSSVNVRDKLAQWAWLAGLSRHRDWNGTTFVARRERLNIASNESRAAYRFSSIANDLFLTAYQLSGLQAWNLLSRFCPLWVTLSSTALSYVENWKTNGEGRWWASGLKRQRPKESGESRGIIPANWPHWLIPFQSQEKRLPLIYPISYFFPFICLINFYLKWIKKMLANFWLNRHFFIFRCNMVHYHMEVILKTGFMILLAFSVDGIPILLLL